MAPAWSGAPSARLLGDGRPTTPEAAAFANSVMIRFLDANDTYIARGSGHPSDMLGALLAAAELQAASGKDLVLATVAGYEVFGALADQVSLRDRGWDQGVFIAPASAAGAGRLLGLSAAQMANAIAIAASANVAPRQGENGGDRSHRRPDLRDGLQRDRKRAREVGPEDAGDRRPQLAVHARRRAAGRSPHPR